VKLCQDYIETADADEAVAEIPLRETRYRFFEVAYLTVILIPCQRLIIIKWYFRYDFFKEVEMNHYGLKVDRLYGG
jgi:hypothetical protein